CVSIGFRSAHENARCVVEAGVRAQGACSVDQLNRHCSGLATADAETRDTALAASGAQSVDQRGNDARAGGADGVALGAGTAVDVDLDMRDVEPVHGQQRDHGEGFVDLEQVDVCHAPVELFQQFFDGSYRGDGELAGVLG